MEYIPFYKPCLGDNEISEVVETLRSGWLTTGQKTKEFERAFGEYFDVPHSVALNSCTAALHLALEAVGIQAGEGVIVPTMTFAATAEVVRYLGARPILVDCRHTDFNLDVSSAEVAIQAALRQGQPVKAIMPVHYAGQIGDVSGIAALSKKYGLKIIEDAAHCCPAYYRPTPAPPLPASTHSATTIPITNASDANSSLRAEGWLPVGTGADVCCFSFYANKCITTGEGGMACTNSAAYADRMRIMSLHGISRDAWKRFTAQGSWYYEILAPGYKYNLTDIAAALGICQLRQIEDFHRRRSILSQLYRQRLGDLCELIMPEEMPERIHSWHLFVIRLRLDLLSITRGDFITALGKAGIGTSVHYMPLHMHPYYRETYGYCPEDLPCMARIYPEIVTLPLYPTMTEEQFDYICQTIRKLVAEHSRRVVAVSPPTKVRQKVAAQPARMISG